MRLDPDEALRRFATGRVAYLATLRPDATAALVPIVFEVSGDRVVSIVDPKPKRTHKLARLRHIAREPRVALLVGHYEDDWQLLWWARAEGEARRSGSALSQTTSEMRGSRSISRSFPCPSSDTQTLKPPSRNSCQTGVSRMLPSDRWRPMTATSGSSSRSPMSARVRLRRTSGMVADMPRSPLADAFGHHVWATLRLIETSESLDEGQLQATAAGTYGSIIDTLRHLVASDRSYLATLSGGKVERVDDEDMTLPDLRAIMVEDGPELSRVIA